MRSPARAVTADVIARIALLIAVGAAISYAESVLVPPLPVPGVRLGLGNIAVVIALASMGPAAAGGVALGRWFAVALATGSMLTPVGAMSLAGSAAAWAVMTALRSADERFSVIGWSVAGAATHVIAQLGTATVLLGTSTVLAFAPVSLSLTVPTGLAVGLAAAALLSRISPSLSTHTG